MSLLRIAGALCLLSITAGPGFAQAAPKAIPAKSFRATAKSRTAILFGEMRDGTYRSHGFPKLAWKDVPDLLSLAGSSRQLRVFPINALSSQGEPGCSEGMIALWLVEGVRKGGRFPSNNALCFAERQDKGTDWGRASEENHPQVLKAYLKWWKRVNSLDPDKAAAKNPLSGTKLHWF